MSDRPSADAPRILGGSPTEEETAAVAAVFAELVAERAAAAVRIPDTPSATAWRRTQRGLRAPLAGTGWSDAVSARG